MRKLWLLAAAGLVALVLKAGPVLAAYKALCPNCPPCPFCR